MNKIKRASYLFRLLFQIIFVLIPILLVLSWVFGPEYILANANSKFTATAFPHSSLIIVPITVKTKILGFLVSLIPTVIAEIILYFLIRLFRLYEQLEIFSIQAVKYIRNIGIMMLIGQILNPIYQALISAVLTWHVTNHHEHLNINVNITGVNFIIVIIALITILISWIMAEACKLHEEQKYIV